MAVNGQRVERYTKKPIVSRPDALLCKHTMRLNGRKSERVRERERKSGFCEQRTNEFISVGDSTNATRVRLLAAVGNRILCYEFDRRRRESKGEKLKKNSCRNESKSSANEHDKIYKMIYFHWANAHCEHRVLFSLVLGRLGTLFSRFKFFFSLRKQSTSETKTF